MNEIREGGSPPFPPAGLLPSDRMALPRGSDIVRMHAGSLMHADWPGLELQDEEPDAWRWMMRNHLFNSRLWNEEDLARRTTVADAEIAKNKRAIDRFNQARNDATERVDEYLLTALGLVDPATAGSDSPRSTAGRDAMLNSETAGSMVDRMSILALKVHAMRQQTERKDVDDAHRRASRERLARLETQRDDLAGCFDRLLADAQAGRAYFKVYRQFKMYNDPAFNPRLVAEGAKALKQ